MKNIKKPILWAITLVIAGLMITSTAVSSTYVEQNDVSEPLETVGVPIELTSMDATVSVINRAELVTRNPMEKILSRGTDVLVFHDVDEEDCQNPALVTDATLSNILIFTEIYEGIGHTSLWGRYSTDGGATWSDEINGFNEIPEGDPDDVSLPKLDYYGEDNWAYGTWTAGGMYDAQTYYLELPDMKDPSYDPNGYGWVYYLIDWGASNDFSDFDSADVGCFPYDEAVSPSIDFWGWIAGTGDRPPGANEEDNMMWFSYFIEGGSVYIISFYNMDDDAEKMATDIDMSIGQPYMAYEYTMEADPTDTGTTFVKSPPLRPDAPPDDFWWQDGSFTGFDFDGVYNPDIAAADGSVYIVGERIDGDKDIVCLYSSDAGESFQESSVTDTVDDEAFPQIALSSGKLICTYTRDGDLYAKFSSDGGVTWVDEEKINDPDGTAVEQYGSVGIDGPYGSWTDDRNAPPTEIYFDVTLDLGDPPGAPTIEGPPGGKPNTALDYDFTATDPDGDDVKFIITWGDGESETTGFTASGTPITASHSWLEKGEYTITAKAQDSNGLIGPEQTFVVNIPRSKNVFNSLFLRIFEQFPNAFPILRYLMGL